MLNARPAQASAHGKLKEIPHAGEVAERLKAAVC